MYNNYVAINSSNNNILIVHAKVLMPQIGASKACN